VLAEASNGRPKTVLISSGTEVSIALAAREKLEAGGVPTRVVSLPSWSLFARQPANYRASVLPPGVPARVSVEAASTFGWSRWLGDGGGAVGLDRFGASAPAEILYERLGITAEHVLEVAKKLL
jgi:transketolase